ncbi:NAD(P)-dependent alcohol dehydrogenase [Nocardia sp. alder85J]|uniref:NAD(P)-dependent alcohol dehydrogenase n=1 Tax=Nocardia sp. alder85J TaxID=2862949 RepID=UPI001CD1E676|nr:NAD(P)-dependent alcohol dehydrogenase [Nocardia sp. alder85J]MCX4094658.1 NAD(P)-dependent alcohol dehydrogenase [Nocardia sp. alder85J]
MRVTAAVLRDHGTPFTLEDIDLRARLDTGEILVRIAGCGLCHTDLAVRGSAGQSPLPAILGHEGAGVVTAVGAGVTDIGVGDHVLLSFDSCGRCEHCLRGTPSYCESFAALNLFGARPDDAGRFTDREGRQLAPRWFGQSAFAQYAVARARNAVAVDRALPIELLGPLGCGFLTGAGSVLSAFRMSAGDTLAVLGAGAVGLAAVMAARATAATVLAVDRHRERLALAERFGATAIPADTPDLGGELRRHGRGGVRFALDTTGSGELINHALSALLPRGTLAVISRHRAPLTLAPGLLDRGRRLVHLCEGDAVPRILIPRLIALWQRGSFPFDQLITTYPLAAINDAERDCLAGRVVKPVLLPPHAGR